MFSRSELTPEGEVTTRRIEKTFSHVAPITELTIGGQVIRTTGSHRFHVEGKGWVPCSEIQSGNRISGMHGDSTVVESVVVTEEVTNVYNVRVAEDHTYFVGDESWRFSVWAHNEYKVIPGDGNTFKVVNEATKDVVPTVFNSSDDAAKVAKQFNDDVAKAQAEFAKQAQERLLRQQLKEVAPNGIANSKSIVIGEGMQSVKGAARGLQEQGVNAKWYQAWGKNFPKNRPMKAAELEAALQRNERWIRSKIDNGYSIYDIGFDPTRSVRSPFYELEQRIIIEKNLLTIPIPRSN